MITKLSHASLFVTDQQKAFDFYVTTIGFKVNTDVTMENGFRWLTITPPDQPDLEIAILAPLHEGMHYTAEVHNAFKVLLDNNVMGAGVLHTPDCRATYEELKAKGVEFTKAPTQEFYGFEALFKDDSGNWFSLGQKSG